MSLRIPSLAALFLALAAPASAAEPVVCGGVDLLAKARTETPEAYAAFERDARAIPNAEGLLWKIEAKGAAAPSYLFGTMHTTEADLAALSEPVRTALAASKTVAVEIADAGGPKVQAAMVAFMTANAIDLSGRGLDGLDDSERAEVGRRLAESGMPAALAASLKPWFLGITLQLPSCETKLIASGKPTIDAGVEALGKANGATIVGLETVDEQLGAVSRMSEDTARRMIKDIVSTPSTSEDLRKTTLELYRERRVGWYLAMKGGALGPLLDVEAYADFMEDIVDRRNRLMAERSRPLIKKGKAFVAVGALHLPGPKGLVALYREVGFTVTPVW